MPPQVNEPTIKLLSSSTVTVVEAEPAEPEESVKNLVVTEELLIPVYSETVT